MGTFQTQNALFPTPAPRGLRGALPRVAVAQRVTESRGLKKTGRERPPRVSAAPRPAVGAGPVLEEPLGNSGGKGLRGSHQPELAGGVEAPIFPRGPTCLLDRGVPHAFLGLVPRTRGTLSSRPSDFLLSGLSLPDASSRQPTLVTPSHTPQGPLALLPLHRVTCVINTSFHPILLPDLPLLSTPSSH